MICPHRRPVLLLLLLFVLASCRSIPPPAATQPPAEEDDSQDFNPPEGAPLVKVFNVDTLVYEGSSRRTAKLTMVPAGVVSYASIPAVTSLTRPDGIVGGPGSMRVGVEANYAQFTAWIYAYNLPADNDFHLLLGASPTYSADMPIINAEVSGLPVGPPATAAIFRTVRLAFMDIVNASDPMTQQVVYCVNPPIPVVISGGPLFDISHKWVGTSKCPVGLLYTQNSWEIHPVTSITSANN